jgi:hypothetical protein
MDWNGQLQKFNYVKACKLFIICRNGTITSFGKNFVEDDDMEIETIEIELED